MAAVNYLKTPPLVRTRERLLLASNKLKIIKTNDLYLLGILSSSVHMTWMRLVAGRLKSDYNYSSGIVYNNFPWPEATDEQKEKIRTLAREILDTRDKYPDSCLADLYDTIAMPTDLLKAHQSLDKEVVKLYGEEWKTESDIISGLFRLYVQKTSS